ncbi:MAG: response regulator [Arcobacteraceae bacterium]|nr:response regulator [Arcobacteraceae bacterium]
MLNIMIVDDSLIIRKTLTTQLEKMGHTVIAQAKSGKEAIELYAKHMPDLVTMDITMPIMSGIEALKEIIKDYKNAKIIMITSHGEEKLVMEAITSGARGYVLKPITEAKIEDAICKAIPEYKKHLDKFLMNS